MDLTNHMRGFFEVMKNDPTLTPHQISLLMVLYGIWNNKRRPPGPFPINRKKIMKWARIGNGGTYDKCLNELNGRYIIYIKGNRSMNGKEAIPALISIIYFGDRKITDSYSGNSAVSEMNCGTSKTGTAPVAKVEPFAKEKDLKSIKSNNTLNKKNVEGEESQFVPPHSKLTPPTLSELEVAFKNRGYSKEEANRFFNVNSARNWKDKNGRSIDLISWIDGWMAQDKRYNEKRGTGIDPKEVIQLLYEKFLTGEEVEREIRPDYYEVLQLTIDESSIQKAKTIRINRLQGSNEGSHLKLLKAYGNEIEGAKEMVQKDFEVVNRIAVQQVVLKYFRECQNNGIENLFDY